MLSKGKAGNLQRSKSSIHVQRFGGISFLVSPWLRVLVLLLMATIYDSEDYFDESEGFSDESEFEEPPMPHVTTPKMVPMNSKVRPCLFCSEQRHDPSKR